MKRILCLVAALFPLFAVGQGVQRTRPERETLLLTRFVNTALTTVATSNATVLPADAGFTVTATTVRVSGAAAGAGTVLFRVSDGTNNCDCTANCLTTPPRLDQLAPVRIACTGACAFSASSSLTLSVTASCATTQPSVITIDVHGKWR